MSTCMASEVIITICQIRRGENACKFERARARERGLHIIQPARDGRNRLPKLPDWAGVLKDDLRQLLTLRDACKCYTSNGSMEHNGATHTLYIDIHVIAHALVVGQTFDLLEGHPF